MKQGQIDSYYSANSVVQMQISKDVKEGENSLWASACREGSGKRWKLNWALKEGNG